MKKVLITGATGFAGTHLVHLLQNYDFEIHGTSLSGESQENKAHIHKLDLLNEEETNNLIETITPDWIFHLAALASPGKSFDNPQEFLTNNTNAQLNILEGARKLSKTPRILIVSSGEMYGKVDESDLPLAEDAPLMPTSPYAVSKITQDYLALQYHISYEMDIVRARPFNHAGPGQSEDFVISAFAKQIAEIEKEKKSSIHVGNLKSKRDFTDVRDMVKSYVALLEKGKSGEVYNVGRGESFQIQFILDTLMSFSDKDIQIVEDDTRMRPSDIPNIICNSEKVKNATGWKAEIPLEKTLEDTLNYWREQV